MMKSVVVSNLPSCLIYCGSEIAIGADNNKTAQMPCNELDAIILAMLYIV